MTKPFREDMPEYHELVFDPDIHISTEYQPIVDISKEKNNVVGYEALVRPTRNGIELDPKKFITAFKNKNGKLLKIEKIIKRHQIENRPKGVKLFLNTLAVSCHTEDRLNFWINIMKSNSDLVLELVEKENTIDDDFCKKIFDCAGKTKTLLAIDDFMCENFIFSPWLLNRVEIIKLDKNFLEEIKKEKGYREIAIGLVKFCESTNKQLILEGIESQEDLELAKELGVKNVQGFLFRDLFIFVQ